jgi:hypothetical protein
VNPDGTEHVVGGMGLGILSLGVRDPNLKVYFLFINPYKTFLIFKIFY